MNKDDWLEILVMGGLWLIYFGSLAYILIASQPN